MTDNTQQKTKKQHYVPRCYLERWSNAKGQVSVFDKATKTQRINNIRNIACQRYFYDVDARELYKMREKCLRELGIDMGNDKQFIEHFLSKHVEGMFADLLSKIISKADAVTPWHIENESFLTATDRAELSICLAFQYVRTSFVRYGIIDTADCTIQVLRDMQAPQEVIDKYTVDQQEAKVIHDSMVLDLGSIERLAKNFNNLAWILCINQMGTPFYTSDSPIGTRAHIDHPIMSMAGIASKGVEVFFPLSPKYMLVMIDGTYHKRIASLNDRYLKLRLAENIDYYNSLVASGSDRIVISSDDNFDVVNRMLEKNPNVFSQPKVEMNWGGRKYHAMNKENTHD